MTKYQFQVLLVPLECHPTITVNNSPKVKTTFLSSTPTSSQTHFFGRTRESWPNSLLSLVSITTVTEMYCILPCVSNLRQLEKRTSHFDTNKETRYFWDFSFDYQPINILLWITSLFISVLYELILWSISLWYCVQSMQWLFVQFRCLELNSDNKCTFKWTDKTGDFFIHDFELLSSLQQ